MSRKRPLTRARGAVKGRVCVEGKRVPVRAWPLPFRARWVPERARDMSGRAPQVSGQAENMPRPSQSPESRTPGRAKK